MSTPETVTEPEQLSKKQQRKRKNAAVVEKPVEVIEDISEPVDEYPSAYVIEEGYSLSTVLRTLAGGVGLGAIAMTLLFGYVRAKEIQRAQQEFEKEAMFIVAAQQAKGQPPSTVSEEPRVADV